MVDNKEPSFHNFKRFQMQEAARYLSNNQRCNIFRCRVKHSQRLTRRRSRLSRRTSKHTSQSLQHNIAQQIKTQWNTFRAGCGTTRGAQGNAQETARTTHSYNNPVHAKMGTQNQVANSRHTLVDKQIINISNVSYDSLWDQ